MRVTYDGPPEPEAGDVLVTTRSAYTVISARQVRSRVAPLRFALEVERGHGGGREVPFRWYPRGPKR